MGGCRTHQPVHPWDLASDYGCLGLRGTFCERTPKIGSRPIPTAGATGASSRKWIRALSGSTCLMKRNAWTRGNRIGWEPKAMEDMEGGVGHNHEESWRSSLREQDFGTRVGLTWMAVLACTVIVGIDGMIIMTLMTTFLTFFARPLTALYVSSSTRQRWGSIPSYHTPSQSGNSKPDRGLAHWYL